MTIIDDPGSSFTQALGESNQGHIVGTYDNEAGAAHDFAYRNGVFQSIDALGSDATMINGINNAGRIVEFFEDASKNTVGFVGKPLSA